MLGGSIGSEGQCMRLTALERLEVQTIAGHEIILAEIIANALNIASEGILCVHMGMAMIRRRRSRAADVDLFLLRGHCRSKKKKAVVGWLKEFVR